MTNEDLKRFYENNGDADITNDFVRYDANGRIQVVSPEANHDVATKAYVDNAVAAAQAGEDGDYAHVHDFTELTKVTPLATVDAGIELHYDNDGKILIPIEGTDDIIVDVDETNKKINIHIDAAVRAKLARTLVTPVAPLTEDVVVTINKQGAQKNLPLASMYDLSGKFYTTPSSERLPSMTKDDAETLYDGFVANTITAIKWVDSGMTWYVKPISVCENDGQKVIVVMFKGYVINYTWADDVELTVVALPWR